MHSSIQSIIVCFVGLGASAAAPSYLEAGNDPIGTKTIDQWIGQLKDGDVGVRREAARVLASRRGAWEKAGPVFLKVENDESYLTVLNALQDSDPTVRATVAAALGWIRGPQRRNASTEVRNAATELQKCLEDSDAAVRCYAACSLIDFASPISKEPTSRKVVAVLFDSLQGGTRELSSEAATAIVKANLNETDVVVLEQLLNHEDPSLRCIGASLLKKTDVRTGAKRAIPSLLANLNHSEPRLRAIVIDTLGDLNFEAPVVVPALIASLTDRDPLVKASSVKAIGRFGPRAKDAAPSVLAALRDADPNVRTGACESLGRIGADPKGSVPALVAMLDDEASSVQVTAIQALASFRTAAKEATPVLHRLGEKIIAGNSDIGDLGIILSALLSIDTSEQTSQLLRAALLSPDRELRIEVLHVCQEHGPSAKAAVPALAELVRGSKNLSDGNYEFVLVTTALEAIGPDARSALPSLIDAFGRTTRFQSRIRRTIEKIDPDAAKALPTP